MNTSTVSTTDGQTSISGHKVNVKSNTTGDAASNLTLENTAIQLSISDDINARDNLILLTPTTTHIRSVNLTAPTSTSEIEVSANEIKLITTLIKLTDVPTFADDKAAGVGGLTAGHLFQTGGQLFIKQ